MADGVNVSRPVPLRRGADLARRETFMTQPQSFLARTSTAVPDDRSVPDLLRRALSHHEAGDLDAAEGGYRRVLELDQQNAEALVGLGQIAGQRGLLADGMQIIGRAIAADGSNAQAYITLAELFQLANRPAEALQSLELAIGCDPPNVRARCLAASALERMNRLDEALEWIEAALALDPSSANAAVVLARLQRRTGELDMVIERLAGIVDRPGLDSSLRQSALHELGMILDRSGRYAEAFAAFEECGREEMNAPRYGRIDGSAFARRIAGYRHDLPPETWTARRAGFDEETARNPRLAFLVGFPRSGTTLTEQVLAAHPGIVTSDERQLLDAVTSELAGMTAREVECDLPAAIQRLDDDRITVLRDVYWREARSITGTDRPDRLFVDKLPLNIIHLGLINVLFPQARIIVALRDPRDVCLSCFMQRFQLNPATVNFLRLEDAAVFYGQVMDLWLHYRRTLTLKWMEIRYEDTVADLQGCARTLLAFLGLDWDQRVLRFYEQSAQRVISTPSAAAVTRPVHSGAVGRWRNYAPQVEPLMTHLEPLVAAFGYA